MTNAPTDTAATRAARSWTGGGPWLLGGGVTALLLVLAARYGYHRDELYFLVCGQHLAWGYVDQGPLTPALARLADTVAPGNLVVLRTAPALMAGASVVLVGALSREFGAGRGARTFAAFLAATSGVLLVAGHMLSTATTDVLLWLVAIWCAVRMLRTQDTRWALGIGLTLGVGMLNKFLPALLGVALVTGVALAGPRHLLRDRWVWLAAGLALLIAAPNVIWQASHGFPQLAVARSIVDGHSSHTGRLEGLLLHVVIISPVAFFIWVDGLTALLRRVSLRPYRCLAWAWIVAYGIILLVGGKGYYDAPLLLVLTAAGTVPLAEGWSRAPALSRGLLAVGCAFAIAATPVVLPILPANWLTGPVLAVNPDAGETVGWPALVDSLASVYHEVPIGQRPYTVILTNNYGEAGAVARFGPERGLPSVYSGHNSMADFGRPPDDAEVAIAVGWAQPDQLRTWFTNVEPAGQVDQRTGIANYENAAPIYLCRGPRLPWPQLWDHMRHAG